MPRSFSTAAALASAASAVLAVAAPAHAAIVERVVAVVGERPVLLSELRHRARPFLYRIASTQPSPAQQAAAETEMFRELLQRMIDDRLEEQAADKAHLVVTPEEVDQALKNIAAQAKLQPKDLVAEARRQGLTEQDYRDELRRQVLEGKLVQLRVRGRVRVTEQDARAAYNRWVQDIGAQGGMVDLRILALQITPGSTPDQIAATEKLAQSITLQARAGSDFCALVQQYSNNAQTKDTCGSDGPHPTNALIPPLANLAKTLKPGEVGDPIRIGTDAVLVVQLPQQPEVPPYEAVKDQMAERAFGESMERQRKLWLQELKRGIYLDVRL